MNLNLLHFWCVGDESVKSIIPQLLGLERISEVSVKAAGDVLDKTSKLSLVLLAQFQIENGLRNVSRALGRPHANGFFATARDLLENLTVPPDRLQILNTPARIRNSLHNNGIHLDAKKGEPPLVVVNGVTYEFRHSLRVQCASWGHVAHALEASVGVLAEVFRTPRVLAIGDPIEDTYSWDLLTTPNSQNPTA